MIWFDLIAQVADIISVSVYPIVQLFKTVSISPVGSSHEVWKSTTWVVFVYFAVH